MCIYMGVYIYIYNGKFLACISCFAIFIKMKKCCATNF